MNKKKYTGADFLAETLKTNKITHVFYQEFAFFHSNEAFEENNIARILAHSEAGSAYMADGYARSTNKLGVCMAQSIGACNLAAGIHDAWLGNTPLLALTGFRPDSSLYKSGYQESNHQAHFSGVTKFNAATYDAQQFPHLLRQSIREATTGRNKPAHLDVIGFAGDVAENAEMNDSTIVSNEFGCFPAHRPKANPASIEKAAKLINESQYPLIIAGRGAFSSDPEGIALNRLSSTSQIPVATTPDGKSSFDESSPLWAGIVGGYGMDCANKIAMKSDLVIYIGSSTSDQTTLNYTAPAKSTQIIQIDLDASEFGRNYPNTLGLLGDAAVVMEQLADSIEKKQRKEWSDIVINLVQDTLNQQKEISDIECDTIGTALLCREISNSLPDNAIIISDTGYSAIWSSCMLRVKPTNKFIRAAGSLGWSIPAAIGAKCGNPENPVICFAGDGAAFYHLLEIETAVRNNINTITVINNNGKLNQCIPYAKMVYGSKSKNYDTYKELVSFGSINFAEIACSLGANGVRITKPEDIAPAIQNALTLNVPTVIDVATDWACPGPLPALIGDASIKEV